MKSPLLPGREPPRQPGQPGDLLAAPPRQADGREAGGAGPRPRRVTGNRSHGTDTIVNVETLVYDMKSDKLVWADRSQSTNPSRVDSLIKELVAAAAAEMKKQGLIRSR